MPRCTVSLGLHYPWLMRPLFSSTVRLVRVFGEESCYTTLLTRGQPTYKCDASFVDTPSINKSLPRSPLTSYAITCATPTVSHTYRALSLVSYTYPLTHSTAPTIHSLARLVPLLRHTSQYFPWWDQSLNSHVNMALDTRLNVFLSSTLPSCQAFTSFTRVLIWLSQFTLTMPASKRSISSATCYGRSILRGSWVFLLQYVFRFGPSANCAGSISAACHRLARICRPLATVEQRQSLFPAMI